jgi:hypothetical protein
MAGTPLSQSPGHERCEPPSPYGNGACRYCGGAAAVLQRPSADSSPLVRAGQAETMRADKSSDGAHPSALEEACLPDACYNRRCPLASPRMGNAPAGRMSVDGGGGGDKGQKSTLSSSPGRREILHGSMVTSSWRVALFLASFSLTGRASPCSPSSSPS